MGSKIPLIAAYDASLAERAGADYLCDGIDDLVEIEQVLAMYGCARFSSGIFRTSKRSDAAFGCLRPERLCAVMSPAARGGGNTTGGL